MQVSDLMTTDLVTVDPDATLTEAGCAMVENHVGSVIVVADAPTGIVTETDVIRAGCETDRPFSEMPVAAAMSQPLVTIQPDRSVKTVLRRMTEGGIKKLPVTEGIDLVGIVTLSDIARTLPEHLDEVRRIEAQRDQWSD